MKAEVSLFSEKHVLEGAIPEAIKFHKSEFGADDSARIEEIEGQTVVREKLYLSDTGKVEILELSNENIGLNIETKFGEVSIFFTPSREFLNAVLEIAIARAKEAHKILNAGE